ncbi:Zn-binding domain-containing protein [Geminocystis herdmanii]|uniref:Zn-binding domain-containing protein n=1 Tax=Geminocystis herdmanii TaxID=669359 RepID=UPI0003453B49|nr:Zn-binding domain-containing protein [Geminocystis herdmanii]
MEGLYACINPECPEASLHPQYPDKPKGYGKLYLNSKTECDRCGSPVIELSSCRKCGQAYGLTYLDKKDQLSILPRSLEAIEDNNSVYVLTSGELDSITNDEGDDLNDSDTEKEEISIGSFTIAKEKSDNNWLGKNFPNPPQSSSNEWVLHWHIPPKSKNCQGGFLKKCPACNAQPREKSPLSRFISYTDAPLEVMIDSLFELLAEENTTEKYTRRKLLTFSDGRQDAAFFASDFQRTHTETLYRQLVWKAFEEVENNGIASVNQVKDKLVKYFLEISIPHPDRISENHHRSYVANDSNEETPVNPKDCKDKAEKRAKELLLREFALPSARRFSLEALGLLSCHLDFDDYREFLEDLTARFNLNSDDNYAEAKIFITGLTNILRLYGAIDLQGSSNYFPETGGIQGGMPSRLDGKGRSQFYVKLQRETKDKNVVSFLPTMNKDNEPTKRQNQLVSFYYNFFNEKYPSRENLTWLFDRLLNVGIFVKYEDGRQLNWNLFNLHKTNQDWHQCNSCQQIFSIPQLAKIINKSNVNIDRCHAPKCDGKLKSLNPQTLPDDHYRYIITQRQIFPLRSQEHTAQLGTEELANRENRFRQGKINLLSCSTTLEMGVDIGELQAVVMRNFPPHVSNYQQRAGRAGRRTDGVAITLMYGQRRPHDRYYFEKPIKLINGKNLVPKLDTDNYEIQKRHIRAELLAEYLRMRLNKGAEKITLGNFFGLSDDFYSMSDITEDCILSQLMEWLSTKSAEIVIEKWLDLLGSKKSLNQFREGFKQDLETFQQEKLNDWNSLTSILEELKESISQTRDRKERKSLEIKRDRIEQELEKIQKTSLHEELAKASILPIYGFPIDVVQLMTIDSGEYWQKQGKHRLQRDRRLALGEYAPGQEIVVDDRVHVSVGVLNPDKLPIRYYWVCSACNYFVTNTTKENYDRCPICEALPKSANEKQSRPYKIPKAFVTDWNETPKVTPYSKPTRQPTSQVFLIPEETENNTEKKYPVFELSIVQGGKFFLSNQGHLDKGKGIKNKGFPLCKFCGRDLSDQISNTEKDTKSRRKTSKDISHTHPITGNECKGRYEETHLGHEFRSDLIKIRFTSKVKPPSLYTKVIHLNSGGEITSDGTTENNHTGLDFWRSITYALLAGSAQIIDVPRSELDGLFRPLENGETEIVIYDNVPGGAGYSKRIAQYFPEILTRTYELMRSCDCSSSCYDCLRTYTNQLFHHQLDRTLILDFLKQIIINL